MVKQFLKKKSKRVSCRKKYKIERKIRQHAKKVRRESKKHPKKTGTKDIGIPNSLPFKDKILQEAQQKKQLEEDMKKKQKEDRHNLKMENRGLKELAEKAEKESEAFELEKQALAAPVPALNLRNFKPLYREFNKVVEAADVVLEVLDARDPLGSRCPQVEKAILDSGPNKRLVFVLNKIDLIPNDNLLAWLKYLKNEFPTVPFKASTQMQKNHISRQRLRLIREFDSESMTTTPCLGAELLMKLLGNYCRSKDIRTSIRVGVVGFPNVGKSSIINSLKRSRACNVGAIPGVTKTMQEVQLDKHIVLLDSPGVVLAQKNKDEAGAALRNALKVENLEDAIPAVEAILRRTNTTQVMLYYRIPKFADAHEFLVLMAKRFGRLLRGGIPDAEAAARHLIRDWNTGKIKYFTQIPDNYERPVHISAEIVSQMAKEFNIQSLEIMEMEEISNLQYKEPVGMVDAIEVQGLGCTEGTLEGLDLSQQDDEIAEPVKMEEDIKVSDSLGVVEETKVNLESKLKKASPAKPSKKTKAAILESTGMTLAESLIEGNQNLKLTRKKAMKKLKKRQRRTEKMADKLSDNFLSAVNLHGSSDENYNFSVDFQ